MIKAIHDICKHCSFYKDLRCTRTGKEVIKTGFIKVRDSGFEYDISAPGRVFSQDMQIPADCPYLTEQAVSQTLSHTIFINQ